MKISTSVKLTGVFFNPALRTARSSWRNTLFQRNAILLHGMLTLGFTLPPFLLSFSTQPLPQRKIRCPVYLTFLTSKSGSRTTYFLLTMSTDQIKSCEVTPLVFTFLFFFIAGESSMDIDIWELLFLPKTTQVIFFFFLMCCQVLLNQQLHKLLVHGFCLCLKDWYRHRCCFYWRFCPVAQIVSHNIKSGWFMLWLLLWSHSVIRLFFLYILLFTFNLYTWATVRWVEEFIVGTDACFELPILKCRINHTWNKYVIFE